MLKAKVTQKEVMNSYKWVIVIPYCAMQHLLQPFEAYFYNSGIYGWNCDIYHVRYNIALCTGYRPFGNIYPNHELVEKYENLAKEIHPTKNSLNEIVEIKQELFKAFLEEVYESEVK